VFWVYKLEGWWKGIQSNKFGGKVDDGNRPMNESFYSALPLAL
jgi:hypothetical protein